VSKRVRNRTSPLALCAAGTHTNFEPGREWRTVNAIHRKSLPMSEKSMLLAIAKYQCRRDGFCHAGVGTLARDVGCNEKTARKAIHGLRKKRIIRIQEARGLSSEIVIDWKVFESLHDITPPRTGRGSPRSSPLPKLRGVLLPKVGVPTPPKTGTQGVKSPEGCGIEGDGVAITDRGNDHHRFSPNTPPRKSDDDAVLVSENESPNHFETIQDQAKESLVAKGEDPDFVDEAIRFIDERSQACGKPPATASYYIRSFEALKHNSDEMDALWKGVRRKRYLRARYMPNFTAQLSPESENRRREFNRALTGQNPCAENVAISLADRA
jgi:hypothetical protein